MSNSNHVKDLFSDGRILCNIKNLFAEERTQDNLNMVLACLRDSMVYVPMKTRMSQRDAEAFAKAKETGAEFIASDDVHMDPDILISPSGNHYLPMFTTETQIPDEYRAKFTMVSLPAVQCIESAAQTRELKGIILDPFTIPMEIPSDLAMIAVKIPSAAESEQAD